MLESNRHHADAVAAALVLIPASIACTCPGVARAAAPDAFDAVAWSPRIGLKANIASGDHDPGDRMLETVNPLLPKFGYFSEADLISPNNFYDLQPSLTLTPTHGLSLTVGWDFVWRQSLRDAVYTSPGIPVKGTAGRWGRFTGDQVASDIARQPLRHIELKASYVHFFAGRGLQNVGAKDVNFAMTSAAYKF